MNNMTSKISCFARAYHYRKKSIQIFSDSKAEKLLGEDYDLIAEHMKNGIGFFVPGFSGDIEEGLRLIVDEQLSPSVLARSAYCEKMLENESRFGCRQYVIFAAGEQMKALYSFHELELLLQECGFLIYEHLSDIEMTEQFFYEYNQAVPEKRMKAPKGVGYVLAKCCG